MACTFCRIADGNLPSRTVYEDDTTVAFLDTNPLAPGHTLVIPRTHYERLNDLPTDLAVDLFGTLHSLIDPIEAAVDADATTVAFNNGAAAGQKIAHVHAHIVPRFENDGGGPIHGVMGGQPSLSEADLDDIEAAITAATSEM